MQPANETILVIEDSRQIQVLIRSQILEPAGYQVLVANDCAAGIRLIHAADLILLDINLPGQSGLDLLKHLRQNNSQIPVIIMTGESSEKQILQSFRLGAQDFLQKPFSDQEALPAIDRVLEQSRIKREHEQMRAQVQLANQQLQTQVQTLSNLQVMGRVITSTLDETDLHRRLMAGVTALMQVEAASMFLMDEHSGELVLKMSSGEKNIQRLGDIRLKPGQGIAGWVAQHALPILTADASQDPRFYNRVDFKTGFTTRAMLTVPLISKNKVLGVLQVINPKGTKTIFDRMDLQIMESLAAFMAVGLENVRLHNAARRLVTVETLKQATITLSHYINNSLTVISLAAEKLQSGFTPTPVQLNSMARAIQEETQRIGGAIAALRKSTGLEQVGYTANNLMLDIEGDLEEWMKSQPVD